VVGGREKERARSVPGLSLNTDRDSQVVETHVGGLCSFLQSPLDELFHRRFVAKAWFGIFPNNAGVSRGCHRRDTLCCDSRREPNRMPWRSSPGHPIVR